MVSPVCHQQTSFYTFMIYAIYAWILQHVGSLGRTWFKFNVVLDSEFASFVAPVAPIRIRHVDRTDPPTEREREVGMGHRGSRAGWLFRNLQDARPDDRNMSQHCPRNFHKTSLESEESWHVCSEYENRVARRVNHQDPQVWTCVFLKIFLIILRNLICSWCLLPSGW